MRFRLAVKESSFLKESSVQHVLDSSTSWRLQQKVRQEEWPRRSRRSSTRATRTSSSTRMRSRAIGESPMISMYSWSGCVRSSPGIAIVPTHGEEAEMLPVLLLPPSDGLLPELLALSEPWWWLGVDGCQPAVGGGLASSGLPAPGDPTGEVEGDLPEIAPWIGPARLEVLAGIVSRRLLRRGERETLMGDVELGLGDAPAVAVLPRSSADAEEVVGGAADAGTTSSRSARTCCSAYASSPTSSKATSSLSLKSFCRRDFHAMAARERKRGEATM